MPIFVEIAPGHGQLDREIRGSDRQTQLIQVIINPKEAFRCCQSKKLVPGTFSLLDLDQKRGGCFPGSPCNLQNMAESGVGFQIPRADL